MSYCRMDGDSDVYVIGTGSKSKGAWWECLGCRLGTENALCSTLQEMYNHLLRHLAQGDKVPEYALERLRKEIATE